MTAFLDVLLGLTYHRAFEDAGHAVADCVLVHFFFFSSRRRHTRLQGDWSSDVCSSDLDLTRLSTLTLKRSRARRSILLFTIVWSPLLVGSGVNHPTWEQVAEFEPPHKIGRASCRERV